MTMQTESGVWASLSRDRQRRLIAQVGQLASRYWEWTRRPEGRTDERDDAGWADTEREGAGVPPRPAGGGRAVVLGSDQPVRRGPAPGGSIEQRPQVAFPICDVHQAGGGHGFRQIGHDLVPFEPAQAFLDVGLVFGLPSPHPSIEHPQHHPRRGDRQGRMHVQPMLGLVAQPAQPGNPRLRGEIQLGGVLNLAFAHIFRPKVELYPHLSPKNGRQLEYFPHFDARDFVCVDVSAKSATKWGQLPSR